MSRRCYMTLRRSGLVFGGFLAHFEPIMEGFKAQTRGIKGVGGGGGGGRGGFVTDFGAF